MTELQKGDRVRIWTPVDGMGHHDHLHIVQHSSTEYENGTHSRYASRQVTADAD